MKLDADERKALRAAAGSIAVNLDWVESREGYEYWERVYTNLKLYSDASDEAVLTEVGFTEDEIEEVTAPSPA